jgi:hypothetical protein
MKGLIMGAFGFLSPWSLMKVRPIMPVNWFTSS